MKIFLVSLLLVLSGTAAAKFPAQVMTIDFTGFPFTDFCTGDTVFVESGDIRVIFRQDIAGDRNGRHLVNHAVGSFDGIGLSGDRYRVNVVAPSFLDPNSIVNVSPPQSTAGVTNIIFNIVLINVTSPGSGVSKTHGVLVFIVNGIGEFDPKMVEISETCVA